MTILKTFWKFYFLFICKLRLCKWPFVSIIIILGRIWDNDKWLFSRRIWRRKSIVSRPNRILYTVYPFITLSKGLNSDNLWFLDKIIVWKKYHLYQHHHKDIFNTCCPRRKVSWNYKYKPIIVYFFSSVIFDFFKASKTINNLTWLLLKSRNIFPDRRNISDINFPFSYSEFLGSEKLFIISTGQ